MIRTVTALLLLLIVSAATACGNDDGEVATPTSSPTATSTPTPEVTATPTASPTTPAVSSWGQYTDSVSGLSFPVPVGLTSTESQTPILLGSGETTQARTVAFLNSDGYFALSLSVVPNPEGLALEEWIQTVPGRPGEATSIQIAGVAGLLFEDDQTGDANATVYFAEGATVYGLRGNTGTTSAGSQGSLPPTMSRDDFDFILEGLSLRLAAAGSEATVSRLSTTTYTDSRFGYSIDLPSGWRPATDFMSAFASTLGQPQAGGKAEDYTVVTAISPDAETQFVADAPNRLDLLTGLGPWLEFFFLDTVQIFPTDRDRDSQLKTADQGSARHIVSNIEDLTLDNGQAATRFTVELFSDYGLFIYDRVFVEGAVKDCPACTGFIIQTARAGQSVGLSGAVDPPLAAYPVEEFEAIFRSFQLAASPSPSPGQLPDTGGPLS